jgi:hypothetical protein
MRQETKSGDKESRGGETRGERRRGEVQVERLKRRKQGDEQGRDTSGVGFEEKGKLNCQSRGRVQRSQH